MALLQHGSGRRTNHLSVRYLMQTCSAQHALHGTGLTEGPGVRHTVCSSCTPEAGTVLMRALMTGGGLTASMGGHEPGTQTPLWMLTHLALDRRLNL